MSGPARRGKRGTGALFPTTGDPTGYKTVIPDQHAPEAADGTGALRLLSGYRIALQAMSAQAEGIAATMPIIGAKARLEEIIREIRNAQHYADQAIHDILAEIIRREHPDTGESLTTSHGDGEQE